MKHAVYVNRIRTLLVAIICLAVLTLCACGQRGSGNSSTGGDNPVTEGIPTGTAVSTCLISDQDGKAHKVLLTVTSIERDPAKVQPILDEYNLSARGSTIPTLTDGKMEYVIANYEVAFPKDFPQDREYGITEVFPTFTIVGPDGSDTITDNNVNYKGLGQTWQIGEVPQGYDFYAGQVYKGAILYMMPKGCDSYRILESWSVEGSKGESHYFQGE